MIRIKINDRLEEIERSQTWAAKKIGVTQSAINRLCKGDLKQIPLETLDKICELLNCKVEDLLEYVPADQIEGKE